jgi:hypothetical protein
MIRLNRSPLPNKDEAWSTLAERRQGEITMARRGIRSIRFDAGQWIVLLDSYTRSTGESTEVFTRWRSVYHAMDDFRFRIYRKSIFSGIGKFFGMQDIEVGQPDIDPDWIIQSSSEGRIQSLMTQREIVVSLKMLRSARLQAKPLRGRHRAPGRMLLELLVSRILREADRLDAGSDLMQSTLDRMARLGSAQPGEDVDLR